MEIEAKFALGAPVAPEQLDGLRLGRYVTERGPEHDLRDALLDTGQGDLERARVALRIRQDGQTKLITFKGAGRVDPSGVHRREEFELPLNAINPLDPDGWPRPIAARYRALAGFQLPRIQCLIRNRRRTWWVRRAADIREDDPASGLVAELALDEGAFVVDGRSRPFSELEIETKGTGGEDDLRRIVDWIRALLPLHPEMASKAERARAFAREVHDQAGDTNPWAGSTTWPPPTGPLAPSRVPIQAPDPAPTRPVEPAADSVQLPAPTAATEATPVSPTEESAAPNPPSAMEATALAQPASSAAPVADAGDLDVDGPPPEAVARDMEDSLEAELIEFADDEPGLAAGTGDAALAEDPEAWADYWDEESGLEPAGTVDTPRPSEPAIHADAARDRADHRFDSLVPHSLAAAPVGDARLGEAVHADLPVPPAVEPPSKPAVAPIADPHVGLVPARPAEAAEPVTPAEAKRPGETGVIETEPSAAGRVGAATDEGSGDIGGDETPAESTESEAEVASVEVATITFAPVAAAEAREPAVVVHAPEPDVRAEAVVEAKLETVEMLPGESLAEAGRAVLRRHLTLLREFEPVARAGEDPTGVHKMRVATRRLRASLAVLETTVYEPEASRRFRRGLRGLSGALAAVRDADVLLGHVDEYRATLDVTGSGGLESLVDAVRVDREHSRRAMLEALDDRKTRRLLDELDRFVSTPGAGGRQPPADRFEVAPTLVRHFAGSAIWRAYESVLAYETAMPSPTETLHRLRVAGKRLRYTLEFFQPALPAAPAKAVRSRIVEMQDALGELQDDEVAVTAIDRVIARRARDAVDLSRRFRIVATAPVAPPRKAGRGSKRTRDHVDPHPAEVVVLLPGGSADAGIDDPVLAALLTYRRIRLDHEDHGAARFVTELWPRLAGVEFRRQILDLIAAI